MKVLVQSLLQATQLLSKDRSELYKALFQVLQGGRISNREITKRLGLEHELIQVYNDIVVTGSLSGPSGHDERAIMTKSYPFAIYSLLMWALGILTAMFIHEYITHSDFLFRFPGESSIY